MLIRIEGWTGVPIWQQIFGQVTRQVMSHSLAAGERLPTVREMASELRVNPNTVARAYQELERAGIVETRRGVGTFACAPDTVTPSPERRRIIAGRIDALLLEAEHRGMAGNELDELLAERRASIIGRSGEDKENGGDGRAEAA